MHSQVPECVAGVAGTRCTLGGGAVDQVIDNVGDAFRVFDI